MSNLDKIIARQEAYYAKDAQAWQNSDSAFKDQFPDLGKLLNLNLPRHKHYSVCNLRGGIGKSTLTFNLAFDTDDVLVVDTCPQGNSSAFFDSNYFSAPPSIYEALLPFFIPGLGQAAGISRAISATNANFAGKNSFYIPSSSALYEFPSTMDNGISQTSALPAAQRSTAVASMLSSLKSVITAENAATKTTKALIDTSPFFSGATHLSWYAAEALLVPVRTDQQSVDSLNLLIQTLSDPTKYFLRTKALTQDASLQPPKIQLVLVTHCGWSTVAGSRHNPNNQTKVYLEKVRDIVARNIRLFTTNDPDNHIVPIDDFLGSGRISSAKAMPIKNLNPGDSFTIAGQRVEVNNSVEKCKHQLSFITANIW